MKLRKKLILSLMLLVVVVCGFEARALPVDGTVEGWGPDSIVFDYIVDGRRLNGQIDFAVYDAYPGDVQLNGQYVYAYQIINSEGSDVGIDSFTVGIGDGASVVDIAFDATLSGGDVQSSFAYFSPDQSTAQSAAWLFLPSTIGSGVVQSGQQTFALVFSSDNVPTNGFAIMEGGSTVGIVQNLPTPIPEPTTIILLGGSWAMLAAIRRRRSV